MIQIKLLEIQKKGIALKKDANNPFFKSKYITLDSIIETYNPILTELSILAYHYTQDNKLITCLFDTEDSTKVESQFNIYTNDPQKQGSEITYGKRYNLSQLLNIQTDEDDDGNKASSGGNTKQFYDTSPSKADILKEKIENTKSISELLSLKDEIEKTCTTDKQKMFFRDIANQAYKRLNSTEGEDLSEKTF